MIQKMITVSCDGPGLLGFGCVESSQATGWTVKEAREFAKEEGFRVVDKKDLCPACYASHKRTMSEGES